MEPEPKLTSNEKLVEEIDEEIMNLQNRWIYLIQLKYEILKREDEQ